MVKENISDNEGALFVVQCTMSAYRTTGSSCDAEDLCLV